MPRAYRAPWCNGEKIFFAGYMGNVITEGGVRWPLAEVWPKVVEAMTAEQVRHHPGGAVHAQDPWPARVYTVWAVKVHWLRNAQEICGAVIRSYREFEQAIPDDFARDLEAQLAQIRATRDRAARDAAYQNRAAAQINEIVQQSAAGLPDVQASQDLLTRMSADQEAEQEFWDQFEERFGNQ